MCYSDSGYVSGISHRVLHASTKRNCVAVAMMGNSVLSAFTFNLLFFIQRETYWRQSLSWFRERQLFGVVKEP